MTEVYKAEDLDVLRDFMDSRPCPEALYSRKERLQLLTSQLTDSSSERLRLCGCLILRNGQRVMLLSSGRCDEYSQVARISRAHDPPAKNVGQNLLR
jgi:hypothetical protein